MDGRIQKFVAEQALLEQAFIKDTTKTVATIIKEAVATVGEKVSVRRFERLGFEWHMPVVHQDLMHLWPQYNHALLVSSPSVYAHLEDVCFTCSNVWLTFRRLCMCAPAAYGCCEAVAGCMGLT